VTQLIKELTPKRLELLHELVPTATVVGLLVNPTDPPDFTETASREGGSAARKLGLQLHILQASTEHDFNGVFANLVQLRAEGLAISAGALFFNHSEQLGALALRHSMPAIFENRPFVAAGGLASYGGNLPESYGLASGYVGRILKGEKPADLPVQQPTKFTLSINLKTAKALGVTVPLIMQMTADEVIE
jgi:putative ABC transport system substrate-binding protein